MSDGREHLPHALSGTPEGLYAEFRKGQRVMTCDGLPGTIAEVLEGPGSNTNIVVLDNDMGGGEYEDSMLQPLNERAASVERTAADDYPELGTILTDRPDLQPSIPEAQYLAGMASKHASLRKQADYYLDTPQSLALSEAASMLLSDANAAMAKIESAIDYVPEHLQGSVVTGAMVHCRTCDVDYAIDGPEDVHEHSKTADWSLNLPLDQGHDGASASGQPGYADGYHQAMAGGAREPLHPEDAAYMSGFNLGWAQGVAAIPPKPEPATTDPSDLAADPIDPNKTAGIVDFIKGDGTPSKTWDGPGHNYSFDWCRFRKNSRCMYPKELNKAASDLAGYAVWVPEDRGYCPRVEWDDQKACPVGEPGPNVPGGFTDATVPWDQGGQRGGIPDRQSSIGDTVPEVSGIVREYAMTPTGSDFFADEADDISRAYRDMPVLDPSVVGLWEELGALCRAQASSLAGRYQIIRLDNVDPYSTAEEMYADVDRGIYKVTSLHSNHPVWDVDTNVAFRVVHDLTGHTTSHSDFSLRGEVIAYQNQCAQTPEHLWPVLFTEIVAQSAYVNVHHLFGEQKVGLIPLTQAEIDAHVGKVMDAPDAEYDALHRSAKIAEIVDDAIRPGLLTTAELERGDGFGFHFIATWDQVRAKARRIRSEGGVRVLSVDDTYVTTQVKGDHHVYATRVTKVPGRKVVGTWECGCPWAAYSWGRTGPWKKFEGRMCSHALATVYEAQSRGMFGKDVHEDKVAPAWLPRGTDVKHPGDWDRDLGRYASKEQQDEWEIVALMVASGASIREIQPIAVSMALDHGLLTASRGPLKGKVRGQVKDLVFVDGDVLDGDEPIEEPILYPTYDPSAGLDFRPTAVRRVVAVDDAAMVGAARAMMSLAKQAEPEVTSFLTQLGRRHSAHLEGLEFKFKSEDSLLRKMRSESSEFDNDPVKTALNMSDTLRYTLVANPNNYVRTVKDCLSDLNAAGYGMRVKNYWERDDPYQGINVAAMTPGGHPFELQFHTPESMRAKMGIHGMYERFRTSELEPERRALYQKMTEKANKISVPGGVELIQSLKRQPYAPLRAASIGRYRYLQLHTLTSATPTTVMREYLGDDDYRIEVWRDGRWVMDNDYARHVLLGEVRTDEISEQQAIAAIAAMDKHGSATTKEGSMADDNWLFVDPAVQPPRSERLAAAKREYASRDEWGLWADADLHEEPEPALPTTDGSDEDAEQVKEALLRALAAEQKSEDCPSCGAANPAGRSTCQKCGASMDGDSDDSWEFTGGKVEAKKDPHAWLLAGSQKSDDVAQMAKAYLQKKALKNFSAAERAQIIDEGEGVLAGNFDSMDLSGTHYQALEAALGDAPTGMDDQIGFM